MLKKPRPSSGVAELFEGKVLEVSVKRSSQLLTANCYTAVRTGGDKCVKSLLVPLADPRPVPLYVSSSLSADLAMEQNQLMLD